jgi:hypothetical protein
MFPPENMESVDLNPPTEPNLIANSIEIMNLRIWMLLLLKK